MQTLHKAEQYIFTHENEAPSVMDLCRETGVSKRTLEYAFRDHSVINPKAYINTIRLNLVHKYLRAANPANLRVADIANCLGFWHIGQLAADYRKVFGENPSITLGRSSGPEYLNPIYS